MLGEDTLTGGDDPLDLRCLPVHPSNASPDDQVIECSACMDNFPKAYPVCGYKQLAKEAAQPDSGRMFVRLTSAWLFCSAL